MSMGVIGLKGFLTDEHHSWVVVAAGGVVQSAVVVLCSMVKQASPSVERLEGSWDLM